MRVVVIGATGHVGGYLIPRLVRAGHDVVALSRGRAQPYREDPTWADVETVSVDREAADVDGTFGELVAGLRPDAVIDMVCFTPESARALVEGLRGRVGHLVTCSSIWAMGRTREVPGREDDPSEPWGEYGIGKAGVEVVLSDAADSGALRTTVLRPGHISGPGWAPINPQGNLALGVWTALATGASVPLPDLGLETLNHVHADDVAQAFELALAPSYRGSGRRYSIVAERAATLRGLAEQTAQGFGRDAVLQFLPFDDFASRLDPDDAAGSREHVSRSQAMSVERARVELGYAPRYRSIDAIAEGVNRLAELGRLDLGGRTLDPSLVA